MISYGMRVSPYILPQCLAELISHAVIASLSQNLCSAAVYESLIPQLKIVSGWSLQAIAGLLYWYIRCLCAITDHRRLLSLLMHVVLQLEERLFI